MKTPIALLAVLGLALIIAPSDAADRVPSVPAIDASDFDRLHAMIQPAPGESPWRKIAWVTNVTEARRRAIAENKPLVIFTAADGSPLGRT